MLIGLTGKSCSGKNRVGKELEDLGFEVWDMDKVAHGLQDQCLSLIEATFGPESVYCSEDGIFHCNRKYVGSIVFNNPQKLKELEDILYPRLINLILQKEASEPDKILVINGALLYRSGLDVYCKALIYVDAPYEVREERAISRDSIDTETFKKRDNAQKDVDFRTVSYRCPLYVVDNSSANWELVHRLLLQICDKIGMIPFKEHI
ncbi:MAG: dephospho-CoA kinase [Sphaerochaetaceae bacterium]|nr:dephospho-CoA kinase [Sphaerochaetaceae bacterium]